MWQIWLLIAGVCLIVEIMTVGFLIFWFSIVAFFTNNLIIQMAVFVISSTILIFATKPFVKKFAHNNNAKTNVYSNIGKVGVVTQDIDSIQAIGQIKVDGEVWSAVGVNDIQIPKGTEVEIIEIKGVKAIVSPVQK